MKRSSGSSSCSALWVVPSDRGCEWIWIVCDVKSDVCRDHVHIFRERVTLGSIHICIRVEEDTPEDKIWMRHEVCDTLKHAPRLKDECWEGDFGQIHPYSVRSISIGTKLCCAVWLPSRVLDATWDNPIITRSEETRQPQRCILFR